MHFSSLHCSVNEPQCLYIPSNPPPFVFYALLELNCCNLYTWASESEGGRDDEAMGSLRQLTVITNSSGWVGKHFVGAVRSSSSYSAHSAGHVYCISWQNVMMSSLSQITSAAVCALSQYPVTAGVWPRRQRRVRFHCPALLPIVLLCNNKQGCGWEGFGLLERADPDHHCCLADLRQTQLIIRLLHSGRQYDKMLSLCHLSTIADTLKG